MRLRISLSVIICLIVATMAVGRDRRDAPVGRLETLFSERAGQVLHLFGRDLFADGDRLGDSTPLLGTIADDYRLGPGDELSILLRGQVARSSRHLIGADGLLLVQDLRPISAAGRSLGEVKAELRSAVEATHLQTEAFISVTGLRLISVLVLGEVARPGRVRLPAFATPLDALQAAGGVRPEGSLRAIQRVEPGGSGQRIDLYDLLTTGQGAATSLLLEGTRLIVPPIGPTVAVAGAVKRPAIFELPPTTQSQTGPDDTADLLELGGGALRPGQDRSTLLRYRPDGVEQPLAASLARPLPLHDGDLLLHQPDGGGRRGHVALGGAVAEPGERPWRTDMRLAELVDSSMLTKGTYRPLAVLARQTTFGGGTAFRALNLSALLSGQEGEEARDGDRLILLSVDDVAWLRSDAVLSLWGGRLPASEIRADCPALASLAAALTADMGGELASGPGALAAAAMEGVPSATCPPLFRDMPDLLPFLLRQSVFMRRGVMRPGPYPIAAPTALDALATLAGGAHDGRDRVEPGAVADIGGDGVALSGAVQQPGVRTVATAGSLRQLLTGSGAPLPDAYALAAILERSDAGGPTWRTSLFAPADVLAGRFDLRLRNGDRITLFRQEDIRPPPDTGTPDALPPAQRRLLMQRLIAVRGAITNPGEYPVAGPVAMDLLLRVAGGPTADTDPDRVELLPPPQPPAADVADIAAAPRLLAGGITATEPVPPGAAIRVGWRQRPAEPRGILLAGEVMEPGTYDLAPGETLSALLTRAGGLTADAYPAGTIFTRESARLAEEEGLRRNARELDRQLAEMLGGKNPPDPARVEMLRHLAQELREANALGRIMVEADPGFLALRPELDIPLMAGDRIHIPKRPLTVTVSGEVLAPASLLFDPEKSPGDYLDQAGGLTRFADDDRVFVIHPNGAAEPLRAGWLSHRSVAITPGAMLVVPRDAEPFEWLPLTQSITTILSQIAFSAAAIAAIED